MTTTIQPQADSARNRGQASRQASASRDSARAQRGLALYRRDPPAIREVETSRGSGVFRVPSAGRRGVVYAVDLEAGTCTCPDFRRWGLPCLHVYAATIADARQRCRRAATGGPSRDRRSCGNTGAPARRGRVLREEGGRS